MKTISFIWDPEKERINKKKHDGIGFEEAKSVFFDEMARVIYDSVHSLNEDRFIILGLSARIRLLVVCHCYKESDYTIRIISARKATKREAEHYGRYRDE